MITSWRVCKFLDSACKVCNVRVIKVYGRNKSATSCGAHKIANLILLVYDETMVNITFDRALKIALCTLQSGARVVCRNVDCRPRNLSIGYSLAVIDKSFLRFSRIIGTELRENRENAGASKRARDMRGEERGARCMYIRTYVIAGRDN